MKKNAPKMILSRETLVDLAQGQLREALGGAFTVVACPHTYGPTLCTSVC